VTEERLPPPQFLGLLLLLGLIARVGYVLAQPANDPTFAAPIQDGAYYVQWARALTAGSGGPEGAFYLAPLYPWLLAAFFTAFGDDASLLYLLQHVLVVSSSLLLALCGRSLAGGWGGLAAAALLLLYHPALFFASRPLGETVALFLFLLALWLVMRRGSPPAAGAGVSGALSALARPNLLLALPGWIAVELARRRWVRAGLILAGTALVLLPVTVRNWRASGHVVPISSNAGITLYHGNGPGTYGMFVTPFGFSGDLAAQRDEATTVASLRAGRALDPVEADGWWTRQAIRTRLADPAGTARLLLRRAVLLVSNVELSLGYAPAIDRNPWRFTAPLPFAALLGLVAAGVFLAGFRGTGGWPVWSAIIACAATPLLFYVSSRYRLPFAVLLCLPAGAGLAEIFRAGSRKRWLALGIAGAAALGSFLAPTGALVATSQADALANRAEAWKRSGDLTRATEDLRQGLELDPGSSRAHFGLGLIFDREGRSADAEERYRLALGRRPEFVEAAQNLSALLTRTGRPAEAIPLLRQALASRPYHVGCWTNLVTAIYATGDIAGALGAAAGAEAAGVRLDPELLEAVEDARRPAVGEDPEQP